MQTTILLESNLSPDQFPLLRQIIARKEPTRGEERLRRLVDALNQYAEGDVPNVRYKDIKDDLSRTLDYNVFSLLNMLSSEGMDRFRANPGKYYDLDDLLPSSSPTHLPGKIKKAEVAQKKWGDDPVAQEFFGNFFPLAKEVLPLVLAVDSMKARAVKRQPKEKVSDRDKYIAPMVTTDKGKLIVDSLTKLSDELKPAYAQELKDAFMERAQKFAGFSPERQYETRKFYSDLMQVRGVFEADRSVEPYEIPNVPRWDLTKTYQPVKLSTDAQSLLSKVADDMADAMQEQFITKNAKKLKAIIDAKQAGLTGAPKMLPNVRVRGILQGDIEFTFDDKSSFRVRNQIVQKYRVSDSGKATHYVQFPTTFHDVRLPDGTLMPQPSEQRMNQIFAKA